jgi:hypothetical protein
MCVLLGTGLCSAGVLLVCTGGVVVVYCWVVRCVYWCVLLGSVLCSAGLLDECTAGVWVV